VHERDNTDRPASRPVRTAPSWPPGNFLTQAPDGDLHVLSQVMHNWDDHNVRRIAGNCARAARPGGSLVLIEYTLPPVPEPANGHLQDILMMVLFGGRERTLQEHREPSPSDFACRAGRRHPRALALSLPHIMRWVCPTVPRRTAR
jgi:hypothetical protein